MEGGVWEGITLTTLPLGGSLPTCPAARRAIQVSSADDKIKDLCHSLLPPGTHVSRQLHSEAEVGLESQHSEMGYRHPNKCHNCFTKYLPKIRISLKKLEIL